MLFVVGVVVVLVVIYIYVNNYKNNYKPDYQLQCAVPSHYLYVNDYKHDYNPNYKPNYKLQCIFSSQYQHLMRKPMMFSITIPTCNGKTSWVPVMLCQRWYNITGGFSTCDTGKPSTFNDQFSGTATARCRSLPFESPAPEDSLTHKTSFPMYMSQIKVKKIYEAPRYRRS